MMPKAKRLGLEFIGSRQNLVRLVTTCNCPLKNVQVCASFEAAGFD